MFVQESIKSKSMYMVTINSHSFVVARPVKGCLYAAPIAYTYIINTVLYYTILSCYIALAMLHSA